MKPKEYVKKHNIKDQKFNHKAFIKDFTLDFKSMLEFHQATGVWNITKFHNVVKEMRQKWDAISNRVAGGLPENLWKYFYATAVVKVKDEQFGEQLKRERKVHEGERAWKNEYRHQWNFEHHHEFLHDFFRRIFAAMCNESAGEPEAQSVPTAAFQALELSESASVDEIKNAFKRLAYKYHPDRGGQAVKFRAIVEAKNQCLAYAESGI
jgi:hypothetical protein